MLVVLIPALGSYVIPDIVGGPTSEMIGNKIAQRVFVDRNLPHASALSALLALAVLAPIARRPAAADRDATAAAAHREEDRMKRSRLPLVTTLAVLVFFYLPIVVLVVNSFNASRFGGTLGGLHAARGTAALLHERDIWHGAARTRSSSPSPPRPSPPCSARRAAFALHRYRQPAAARPLPAGLHAAGHPRDPHGHEPAALLRRPRAGARAVHDLPRARDVLRQLRGHGRARRGCRTSTAR